MPASPSSGRGKWRRRKRKHQQQQQQQPHQQQQQARHQESSDNEEEQDEEERNDAVLAQPEPGPSSLPPDPELRPDDDGCEGGVRVYDFPPVTRREVRHLPPSVAAVVEIERANSAGRSSSTSSSNGGSVRDVLCLENVSYGQLQAVSAVPRVDQEGGSGDGASGSGSGSVVVVPAPKIMGGKGVVKNFGSRVHVLPVHSDWFSPATVHRLERQVVPHFFSGKSPGHTPEMYIECRNYVVARYMEHPQERLTLSDCLGLVAGIQKDDLTRIYRFLDHWGIINYCASTPTGSESWDGESYLSEDNRGEVHVPSTALKSIDSLIKFDKPKCRLKVDEVYSSSSHNDDMPDLDRRIRERLSENHCYYCSRPLPNKCYQSQKEADISLCSDCFHGGRFVAGHSSLDFVKMDSGKDYSNADGENWSDQETLLLLEGLELYNENWNEIAEHVGTKSKAQCILHFLRLPVEGCLLENLELPSMAGSPNPSNHDDQNGQHSHSNGSCQQDTDFERMFPFANSGNPVMALVAFLATAVAPRVAAACAHASLAALSEDDKTNQERSHGQEGSFQGDGGNSGQQKGNDLHGSSAPSVAESASFSEEKVKAAAKVGLAAAATKAKLFADHEEREIQRLSANIINHQLKRLELKLKQFAEVETFLMKECEQVEKTRQRYAGERARMVSTSVEPTGTSSQMNIAGLTPMVNNHNLSANRQQQMMPTASSQSSISGFVNNQQVHPHMSFMQQQRPAFPLGPQLPLSAIQQQQPSSSSNPMFNASGNSQPGINQMLRSVSGSGSGLG